MADPMHPAKAPSRLWRIVLVVSLALNLAVAGLIVGAAASGRWKDGPPPNFEVGFGPMGRALEPAERRAIRRDLIRSGALRALNLRGGMGDIVDALQADPFDAAQLRELMAVQGARTADLQARIQDALIDVITDMSPERRGAFAAAVVEETARIRRAPDRGSGG